MECEINNIAANIGVYVVASIHKRLYCTVTVTSCDCHVNVVPYLWYTVFLTFALL